MDSEMHPVHRRDSVDWWSGRLHQRPQLGRRNLRDIVGPRCHRHLCTGYNERHSLLPKSPKTSHVHHRPGRTVCDARDGCALYVQSALEIDPSFLPSSLTGPTAVSPLALSPVIQNPSQSCAAKWFGLLILMGILRNIHRFDLCGWP